MANASFYMTMVSIIQSLALGYFATALKPISIFAPISPTAWLLCILTYTIVIQMIVVTWHEYAIGSICFKWPLGYSDSWIPILLGLCEYFVIYFATVEHTRYTFACGRPTPCFFIAFVVFLTLTWFAFQNQYRKTVANRDDNKDILALIEPYLLSTRKLMFANVIVYLVAALVTWRYSEDWISILFLVVCNGNIVFHAVRGKRAFDLVFSATNAL